METRLCEGADLRAARRRSPSQTPPAWPVIAVTYLWVGGYLKVSTYLRVRDYLRVGLVIHGEGAAEAVSIVMRPGPQGLATRGVARAEVSGM
ncbi:hypothetical protein SY2F82_11250 [Streptomyces sp. Y2F8-2]|nr:hypothetical protein SY2F82_11250 [Streptomyces sp. Y2F8-2]